MKDTEHAYLLFNLPERVSWIPYEIPWWVVSIFLFVNKN